MEKSKTTPAAKLSPEEILKITPPDRTALNQLGEAAAGGDEEAERELKDALVCLGVHMAKQHVKNQRVRFEVLMQQVDLEWFAGRSEHFTTHFQYVNDASRYLRQAFVKAVLQQREEEKAYTMLKKLRKLKADLEAEYGAEYKMEDVAVFIQGLYDAGIYEQTEDHKQMMEYLKQTAVDFQLEK